MDGTWLRWVDAEGQVIMTGSERAEEERARAQLAQEQARRAAERADRLAAQLRQMGVEPES